jgi:hypothetical protein
VEKPLRGKVQKTDFSTSLGNPHSLGCYWDMNGSLSDDNDRKTHNSTSPEINLLQPKNGLDFGVHFNIRLQMERDIACKHIGNLLRVVVAKRRELQMG